MLMVPANFNENLMIRTWSYSRLAIFEACRYRAKLAYVDKIPEPPRPLPPGKTEHANDRGTRIHEAAELFVRGGVEMVHELKNFKAEFEMLRTYYKEGRVSLEGDWAFNKQWLPVAPRSEDVWVRMKLDALVFITNEEAIVIDYKTGRKDGNEVKHGEQGQLYQLGTFLRYPKLKKLTVEFWYLDKDDISRMTYTREQGLRLLQSFEKRGSNITDATTFPERPNAFSCKWCPYGPAGTAHCKVGIQ